MFLQKLENSHFIIMFYKNTLQNKSKMDFKECVRYSIK